MDRHEELRALDLKHVWHPFTQSEAWSQEDFPIIERAEGCELFDLRGRRYLDGIGSLWCNLHGHRVSELDAALRAQLERVAHATLLGQANVPSIYLAARLAQLAPEGLTRVFYSDSGSTAVEVALKLAVQYWSHVGKPEKHKIASLEEAYHGDTIGSVSIGPTELFHRPFRELLFPRIALPTPYTFRRPAGQSPEAFEDSCIRRAEATIAAHAHELAAVVIEPLVQGAAGMIVQPKGFLARIAAACRAHDVLLICDEVATGFGHTGTLFAVEQEGVAPDLLCLAKGLTGGYLPLAATLTSEKIHHAFTGPYESRKTFFHGHTYTGNPLACAVALASLDLFEKNRLLAELPAKEARLRAGLAPLAGHPHVGEVRQRGVMIGIELVEDRASGASYPYARRMGHQVVLRARAHGVIVRPLGDVVVLLPPIAMSEAQLDELCRVVVRSIDEATRG